MDDDHGGFHEAFAVSAGGSIPDLRRMVDSLGGVTYRTASYRNGIVDLLVVLPKGKLLPDPPEGSAFRIISVAAVGPHM